LKDKALAEPALKALATTDDPKTPAAILDAYPTLDLPAKRAAINTLSFRPALAKALMKAVKANKIPKTDLTAYTVRQLRSLNDKEIDAWTNEVWGVARSSNEQKLAEIAKLKAMLTPDLLKTGDASAGRALFSKTCMQCHTLFGEGGHVGPDLTGSNRADLDYLLVNVTDPSAVIAKDYMVSIIYMADGDAFSGIITKEDDQSVTVTLESSVQTLDRKEVKEIRHSEQSMMPEGLLTPLPKQDVVNLITYLRSPSQVPLPK
jgi:putative heme-binding domain-containing protein